MAASNRKHIVVTGVSRGLGLAMTAGFIAAGHTVLGCSRNEGRMAELKERWPAPHDFQTVDVSRAEDVARWAADVLARGDAPDLLVNNAALINRNAPLWETTAEEFSQVVDVNIKGVANIIRGFAPAMIARGRGVIVNFSSGWGRSVSADVATYCATKWAIEGLTKALAEELPRGMAAIPVSPGVIHTEMLESCFGAEASSFPDPDRWAEQAVPYLLDLDAGQNGESLTVPS